MKKCGEDVRPADVAAPAEEMEKKQKILLWLMEGQKELVQHKRSSYGSVLRTAAGLSLPVCFSVVLYTDVLLDSAGLKIPLIQ